MAERKKYPYDEKAKERIMRYQKKAYSPLNLNLKKGLKEKYKAFAASRGMSITEMIIRYLDSEIEKTGFVYTPEGDEDET
jgi:uncharacterized membrane protein YcgQ (UPF0703/DUF1980 family)